MDKSFTGDKHGTVLAVTLWYGVPMRRLRTAKSPFIFAKLNNYLNFNNFLFFSIL